jgi:hypothetical protein
MAFNRKQARPLCTDTEYALFSASLADTITELTPAKLRSQAQRARRARDKYRDLEKRQRLANRARTGTKKGSSPASNQRTAEKAQLFDETLARFEARAAKLAAAAERETRRKEAAAALAIKQKERSKAAAVRSKAAAARTKAAAARSKLAGGGKRGAGKVAAAGPASESVRVAARGKLARDTRAGARKGHQSAAGKRSQARRDQRS